MKPSAQLRHLHLIAGQTERISIRSIISALGENSFALVLMALAIINIILTPVPGQGMILSIPMTIIAMQWLRGMRVVTLPTRVAAGTLPSAPFQAGLVRALPTLLWLEKYCRNRAPDLARVLQPFIRSVVVALCAFLFAPIPLSHIVPDIAIILITLGELEDDGWMVTAGLMLALACLGGFATVTVMAIAGLM